MTVAVPEKRAKSEVAKPKVRISKIFSPFRTIGHVSDGTPFAVGTLGQTFYIATVVGRSFQIYDAATLRLLFVSTTQTKERITAITAHSHYVFCAYGNHIGIFRRGKLDKQLTIDSAGPIIKLCTFGSFLVAATSSTLHIFESNEGEKYPTEFYTSIPINSSYGQIIDITHMPTYLNKVIVATSSILQIINIRSSKIIFTTEEGLFPQITAIESAPVLDIIALGHDDGQCTIYNVRKNKTVQKFNTGSHVSTTSLSFRTDGTPHLMCALRNGDLYFYDLARKTHVHTLRGAHQEQFGGASKASFLNGQPIVVSTGYDNTLKEFVFDPLLSSTNTAIVSPPRHLRSRGGHSSPPTTMIFADTVSHFIDSASEDRSMWSFSLRKDAQSQEFSQRQSKERDGKRVAGLAGHYRQKFNPITMIAQENAREGDWDNMLTAHRDETFARTWDSQKRRVGVHQLDTIDGGLVKCVAMTQCGNFGLVGSSNGGIGVYNMQSGMLRKKYKLHKKACTGVCVDASNRKMVSIGLDGIVGFYDFAESKYLGKLTLDAPITQMVYHRTSDLVALALDDLSIVVIDAMTQKVVRQLFGHRNRITAMDFTPDGRWLVSSSLDATIRTWDLPTGNCIDGIKVESVTTSLRISPRGDYMATTHVGDVGISLWTNKAQFRPVAIKNVDDESEFANTTLPNVSGDGGASMLEGAFTDPADIEGTGQYISPDQLFPELVTLSHCSRNKFATLLHLDTIRERNKPKEAPKKPESAPFFMELTGSAVGDRAKVNEEGEIEKKKVVEETQESNILALKDTDRKFESDFTRLLREAGQEGSDYSSFLNYLIDMSPAATDLELRTLSTSSPYTELSWFLDSLAFGFRQNTNYELLTALLSMLMRYHGDIIYQVRKEDDDTCLLESLDGCNQASATANKRLDELIKYSSCIVNFVSSA